MAQGRPRIDWRELHGPFDIFGDVHGCADELEELLGKLGYRLDWSDAGAERRANVTPPDGRMLVFVGDLVDRGPRTPDVLRIAMDVVEKGRGFCVEGNHDNKLARWLAGRDVKTIHGLQASADQMSAESPAFREKARTFLENLPTQLVLDGGRLVVVHAGLKEEMIGRQDGRIRSFAMYGDTSGERDEYGYPVRADWAAHYSGEAAIVYGHVAAPEIAWFNNTICIDAGCVFGGDLVALRWPERELVSVKAKQTYYSAGRPLEERARR